MHQSTQYGAFYMLLMLTCNDELHLSVIICIHFASSDRLQACRLSAHLFKMGWRVECCGWWRKRVKEKWSGERLRSVCPVRFLPLHNLWAAGADHHGSVLQAAPGAMWDRPVNWMLWSCWARKAPLFYHLAWETDQPQTQLATFELKEIKEEENNMQCLLPLIPQAVSHLTYFLHLNRHLTTPPFTPTHTLCQPLPTFPPSAFFITDSSASVRLSHMHSVEGRQSPSITLISW